MVFCRLQRGGREGVTEFALDGDLVTLVEWVTPKVKRTGVCWINVVERGMHHTVNLSIDIPYSSIFSRSNNFVIFVRCKLITKFLSTKNFTPLWVCLLEQQ